MAPDSATDSASAEDLSEDPVLVEASADVSTVDDLQSAFEFNPSAQEFIPGHPSPSLKPKKAAQRNLGTPQLQPLPAPAEAEEAMVAHDLESVGTTSENLQDRFGPRRSGASRRSTNSIEAPSQVSTLVVKNLGIDLPKATIVKHLEDQGVPPNEVEYHLDSSGAFRGTAFVRYSSPGKAMAALQRLGVNPELGGRKARVEIQKSKTLIGRRCLEAELPQDELATVRKEIEAFLVDDSRMEVGLSPNLNVQQRKYAHSLAERHSLVHVTKQGSSGEKYVHLSKERRFNEGFTRAKAHSFNICSLPTTPAVGAMTPAFSHLDDPMMLPGPAMTGAELAYMGSAIKGTAAKGRDGTRTRGKKKAQSTQLTALPEPQLSADAMAMLQDAFGLLPPAAMPLSPAANPAAMSPEMAAALLSSPLMAGMPYPFPFTLPPAPGLTPLTHASPHPPGLEPPEIEFTLPPGLMVENEL